MRVQGIPASPGISLGPAFLYVPESLPIPRATLPPEAATAEWTRLEAALALAHAQIAALRDVVAWRTSPEEAAIFDAHLLMLHDEELLADIRRFIYDHHLPAEAAVADAIAAVHAQLLAIEDEYLRARAGDMQDIGQRVIACLMGKPVHLLSALAEPSIIVARDLLPSDTAALDPAKALGLVIELGGPTAHTAILARQMGIPAVVAAPAITTQVADALHAGPLMLAVDGDKGIVEVNPTTEQLAHYTSLREHHVRAHATIAATALQPSLSADGFYVPVVANIGQPRDLTQIAPGSVPGVGLFRTEFLFLERNSPPTEAEQVAAYATVGRFFADGEIIIRTLDIGGDKLLPYLPMHHEENPFLGVRGLRLCLTDQFLPLFRSQLRAILRAATQGFHFKVMFPMVNNAEELRQARAVADEVARALDAEGVAASAALARLPFGAMIETPAAALNVDLLATAADFFSIGTNDLTQYILAIDRMNPFMARHYTPFAPPVLRAIYTAITAAHANGKKIGMCGEMASDRRAVPLLLGLGLDELSVAPHAIGEIKHVIRQQTLPATSEIMRQAYRLDTAEAVVTLLESHLRASEPLARHD